MSSREEPVHSKRSASVAIWLIVLSTLAFIPGGHTRFVFPKVAVAGLAIAVGAFAQRSGRIPRAGLLTVVGAATILAVAAALAPDTWSALAGRWPRYEGVAILAIYAGALWLGARLLGGRPSANRRHALHLGLTTVGVVLASVSILDALGRSPLGPSDATRPGALLGNASDLGIVAMLGLAILLGPALRQPSWVAKVGAFSMLTTLGLAGSRAALLATLAVVVVHLILGSGRRRTMLRAVLLLAITVVVLPQTRDRLLSSATVEGRWILWKESAEAAWQRAPLGTGPSGYVDIIGRYHGQEWVETVGVQNPPDSPHNWLLQAWFAGGLPLAILAVTFVGWALYRGWRHTRCADNTWPVGLLAATAGYVVALATHFTTSGTTPLAALFIGAMIARPVPEAARQDHLAPRLLVVGAAAIVSLGSLAACVGEIALEDGMTAAQRGETAVAVAAFERAQRWRPWDPDISMLAAASLALPASNGDTRAARSTIRWAKEALKRHPDSYSAGLALAVALNALDAPAEAQTELDRLITLWPTEPQALIQRAISRALLGNLDGAVRDLRAALRLDPYDETAATILRRLQQVGTR